VAWKFEPESNRKGNEGSGVSRASSASLRDIDWLGAVFFGTSITTGLAVTNLGGKTLAWSDPIIVTVAVGCMLSVAALVFVEVDWAKKPLIPPKLLQTNGIGAMCLVQVLLCGARVGVSLMIHACHVSSDRHCRYWRKSRLISSAPKT
jgi:hypothetical protein